MLKPSPSPKVQISRRAGRGECSWDLAGNFSARMNAPHMIDLSDNMIVMRGLAALAAAIREDAAPALKEINFESFNGGNMGGDSTGSEGGM